MNAYDFPMNAYDFKTTEEQTARFTSVPGAISMFLSNLRSALPVD